MDNLTPNDFKIIPQKNKVRTDDGSEATGGTIGGLGTTPVSDIEDVLDEDGNVDSDKIGGEIPPANLDLASRGWLQTCAFSVTDADTVSWGAGTLTAADGTAYSIDAGNTGNMSAKTFIYFDTGTSETEYQTSTTATDAVGAGKVMVAIAENGTGEASFITFQDSAINIPASNIVANSITANELSTSITYAGTIIVDTAGNIRSGQTAYNTGTGWWVGNDGGTPKLSIGNPSGFFMTWDGSALNTNFAKPVIQVYTSDDTWTKPSGLRYIMVELVGGGGGGGGNSTATNGSGGGGAGGYSRKYIAAGSLGSTESVTVGAAGTAGAGSGGTGGTGGTTSFGAHLQATGGAGGTENALGGAGGSGSSGDLNTDGANGGSGNTNSAPSGFGGNSYFGGGGPSQINDSNGIAATGYGGGGGGAFSSGADRSGGAGKAGVVYVTEYYT